MIQPRTLKGFRDFLPEAMMPREWVIDTARRVFRSYGFSPIDTPTLEYLDILTGKGGTESDKQLYQFEDHGGRQVGMRFDLTVPLARFAAQHIPKLGTPFKRYHIATVWRGENTQRGRYREFMQCDFDTIGTTSTAADIETVLVIHDLFRALRHDAFKIHVNNRKVLSGLLEKIGVADRSAAVLRALDKLAKIGYDKVALEMIETAKITSQQAADVLKLAEISESFTPEDAAAGNQRILSAVEPLVQGSETGQEGLAALRELIEATERAGMPPENLRIDVSIARGLDYYTATVYETFLDRLPGIGSVCSGGRYDNLAELYTKQQLPGVGASLGMDRLLAAMEELEMLPRTTTPAQVFIPFFDKGRLADYLWLAAQLRGEMFCDAGSQTPEEVAAGIATTPINVEVYPEPKRLGQQLKYADRKGFRVALIAGSQELDNRECQIKDLAGGGKTVVSLDDKDRLVAAVRHVLESTAAKQET